jgi:FkbM family methyltransferase
MLMNALTALGTGASQFLYRFIKGVPRVLTEIRNLGLINAIVFRRRYAELKQINSPPVALSAKHSRHPLWCRPGTTDVYVFYTIFAQREYSCLDDLTGVGLIIDCGANVGYSSAYFLSRFPDAKVIAIEPDERNFEAVKKNLAPFGDRVTLIRSGVWSHPCGLVVSEDDFGTGGEWARQVRECREGETAAFTAVSIDSVLKTSGYSTISILKIDVEGAERVLFSSNYESWIHQVENMVIELHGEECQALFFRAIQGLPFAVSRSGELTVCKKKALTPGD